MAIMFLKDCVMTDDLIKIAQEAAQEAVRLYATQHPAPPHINAIQAAEILKRSPKTVRAYIKAGSLKLNKCGLIPINDVWNLARKTS